MESEIFEKLSPTKLFFRCAIPSMITMAFGALYQVADGLFVGRFIGGDALAAVNLIMPVIMMVFALSDMIAVGASVRISMLLGEKKQEAASEVFSFTIKIIFFISCLLGFIESVFAESVLRFLAPGASGLAIEYGVTYIRVYALFTPFMPVGFATDNFLRVCGKERLSMWIGIGTQALNIIMDIFLIVFLGQGVWAAAFTSCIAMTLGSGIMLWLFLGKRMDIYYTKKNISAKDFLRILANGSSEFFSNVSMSVMSVVLNLFLLKYGGTTAVAAFSVVMYVDSIVGMLIFGMCGSLQPAVSYCYGAGLIDKVRAIFRRILIGAVVLSGISMVFMQFAGPFVVPIFIKSDDTELLNISIVAIKLFSFSYLVGWVDMCFSSYFTALERPIRSLITSGFGTLVFPIMFLFVLTEQWGLHGIWLMPAVSGTITALLTIILALTMELTNKK